MRWQQIASVCVPHGACIGDFSVRIKIVEIVFPHQNGYRLKVYMRAWFDARAGAAKKKTASETITHFLYECVSLPDVKWLFYFIVNVQLKWIRLLADWMLFSAKCIWCLYDYDYYYYIIILLWHHHLHHIHSLTLYFRFVGFLFSVLYRFSPLYYPSYRTHTITRKSIFSTFKLISNSNYHMYVCVTLCACEAVRATQVRFFLSGVCVLCSGCGLKATNVNMN